MGNVLRSLLFYLAFYGGTLLYVLTALGALLAGGHGLPRIVESWSRYHRRCARHLLGIGVKVEGDLPRAAVLIAMKHESYFEAIDLPNLFPYPAIFAKAELLRIPLWGRAAAAYGLIPVERAEGARALRHMIAAAKALSEGSRPLLIFPEGTRVPHGAAPTLQPGFAGLYKVLGLPVVPVAVDSGPLYHRTWKRPGTITVRVGVPITPGLPRAEMEARVHQDINALNPKGN